MRVERKFIAGFILCLLGLLGNVFSLPLFEGFNYLFGSIPVFLALRLLGIRWAFLVALVASSWVNVLFWHPNAMIWLCLEPIAVGLMMRKTPLRNMVICDALYWPFCGNLILWLVFRHVMDVPLVGTLGAMLMFWLIGINNALIAELLLDFLPIRRWVNGSNDPTTVSLNRILFSLSTTLVWIPMFVLMAINGQRITADGKRQTRERLEDIGAHAVQLLDTAPPTADRAQWFVTRMDGLEFPGVSPRFILTNARGGVMAASGNNPVPGDRYTPESGIRRISLGEGLSRVIPILEIRVPRWRLAQLSRFLHETRLPNGDRLWVEAPFGSFQSRILKQQLFSLLVLVIADVLVLVVTFFFSRTFSRTIIRLGEATRDLPEKIYRGQRTRWPATAIAEVADLIANFRETAAALRDRFKEIHNANAMLESRVRERTTELEHANRELMEEIELRGVAETERRLLEERISRIEKMESLGRLAGGVAHDFNNLLTPIIGYAEFLGDTLEDEGKRAQARKITEAARRAADLTRQILAFSRKQVLEFETVDVNQLIRDFSGILNRLIGEDIEVVLELGAEPDRVTADPTQIHQVLMNLAVNSRDAMPSGGRLILRTQNVELTAADSDAPDRPPPGPYLRLIVADTGAGMDEETRDQIFEPFFTTKEAGKGTGLGLATVYGIVKQHGGTIQVETEPGEGTAFLLDLPLARTGHVARGIVEEQDDRGGNESILLVEDADMVRDVIRAILEKKGYRVVTAESGEVGLALLEEEAAEFDLIITDMILPGLNGLEFSRTVRRRRPETPVLYISGYTADVITERVREEEAELVILRKPFSAGDLLARVRSLLDREAN